MMVETPRLCSGCEYYALMHDGQKKVAGCSRFRDAVHGGPMPCIEARSTAGRCELVGYGWVAKLEAA